MTDYTAETPDAELLAAVELELAIGRMSLPMPDPRSRAMMDGYDYDEADHAFEDDLTALRQIAKRLAAKR